MRLSLLQRYWRCRASNTILGVMSPVIRVGGTEEYRLTFRERVADAGHYGVPALLFGRGIVDQYTSDHTPGEIAAIIPDQAIPEAGHHKETGSNPSVDDARGWVFLGQKGCRRVVGVVMG